jgi:SRSO17 transposase
LAQQLEVKYHRSNASAEVSLQELAQVRGGHWSVEQSFQACKGECGLDEYETRGWLGWHHHTALAMLALWFLGLQRQRLGEKRATDDSPRGTSGVGASARRTSLGQTRNPQLVGVAARA